MSDTILTGDITVYYLDENRQKRLEWTGSATGTRTMNEVYSAMANLLDESDTGDDATCMSAETPVEYTIGLIDANDIDPWFISYECLQHLTGGALKTSGWNHVDGSATGIVVAPVATGGAIVPGDVGFDITHAAGDAGTLLEVLTPITGGTEYLVIRPDTNAAGDSFDSTSGNLTCNAHVSVQNAAANTGEQIWPNLYNVTPIDDDTHVYMYQGTVADGARSRIFDINDDTQDWWPEGAFDRCFYINDYTDPTFSLIDGGNITVFARKGNTLYDSFEVGVSTTSGGRNPVPLSASADGNNTTGYASTTISGGTGNFSVGDEIQDDGNGARGIITKIDNPGATATLHYYLIGDPQTDFDGGPITNNDDTGAATGSTASTPQGPALSTWFTTNTAPTVTHGATTFDIDDAGGPEGYGITLDCKSNPLTEVYEWAKYITRNGETTTTNTDGIEGEQYVGPTVYLEWSGTVTGTMTEGNDVTQAGTGATGIIVSKDETTKQMLLRDVRGTFNTAGLVTDNDASGTVTPNIAATAFNALKSAPYGSLAGGRYFGTRGLLLTNVFAADENNYQLIDSSGTTRARPITITLSISNLVGGLESAGDSDRISMHRLTGTAGPIDKTEYSAAGGEAQGANTITVDGSITADTAGKAAGGYLNIRDASDNNKHYMIRFDSWTGSVFTLSNFAAFVTTATTNATQVTYATGGFDGAVKRGDLVMHTTKGVAYVKTVDSDTQLTLEGLGIPTLTSGDTVEINAVPMSAGMNTADDVYVSLIDGFAESSSASVAIVYVSPLDFRAKVSNTRNATKIKRFVTDDITSGGDRNIATIRSEDTIHA